MTPLVARLARAGVSAPLAFAGLAYATLVLPHASGYTLHVLCVAGIYALLALGYSFIFGQAGALSLAQGTFMGVGAYVSGILAVRYGVAFDAALPASIGVPVLLAWATATPTLRLQTHYFALATLLIGQIALVVATQWQSVTGGANGVAGVPPLSLLGHALPGRWATLAVIWSMVAAGGTLAWLIGRGRLGMAFAVMRAHPQAAQALGLDTGGLRRGAFLLSAAYAGLAGSLSVHEIGVLSPDMLGFPVMVTCLVISVLGSRRSVAGVIAAAVLVTELPEWVRPLREDYLLADGCILLLMAVALPDGLAQAAERLMGRLWAAPPLPLPRPVAVTSDRTPTPPGPLLRAEGLHRSFGGVRALAGVSLDLAPGEVLGLIGPNGSGKTTLLNVLCGVYPPDDGQVWFAGQRVSGQAPHSLARLGLVRTFQTPALAPDLSVLDNVALARHPARSGFVAATSGGTRHTRMARAEALALLDRVGMTAYAASPAATLPAGAARLVELARAMATDPRAILLDEPAAGLNGAEQASLSAVLRQVAASGVALLLVEHNMPFLMPLAHRVLCLDHGVPVAAGSAEAVRADPHVVAAYLGQAVGP